MKNFSLIVSATLALVLAPAALALADGALYVTPKLGIASVNAKALDESERKTLVPFGLAVGYDLNPVRAELEYAFRAKKEFASYVDTDEGPGYSSSDSGKLKLGVQTLFLNGYYDIHNSSSITPYVGLGLGLAKLSYDLTNEGFDTFGGISESYSEKYSGSKTKFAWNIGAGAAYQINDLMALDLGYRYANFGKVSLDLGEGGGPEIKSNAHEVMLGLRFSF